MQSSRSSACQRSSLDGLGAVYGALPSCPVDVTPQRALLHTLGSGAGYGDSATLVTQGAHTVYQRGKKVALPTTRGGHLKLATVAPECVQQLLVEHDASPLLSSCPSQFSGRLAFDPRLARDPKSFGHFLGTLWHCGLVRVAGRGEPRSTVAPFFVMNKDGSVRAIC